MQNGDILRVTFLWGEQVVFSQVIHLALMGLALGLVKVLLYVTGHQNPNLQVSQVSNNTPR